MYHREHKENKEHYYKDPEPWKHEPKPEKPRKQILKILLALAICLLIVHAAVKIQGYDWNDFGFVRMLQEMITGDYDYVKPPAR